MNRAGYRLLYTFIFMGIGVLTTLIGPYLDHIGFTGQQIGIVTAAGTCTAIFAAPFWGRHYSHLARRAPGRRRFLVAVLCVCAATVSLLLHEISFFAGFLPAFVLLYFVQAPLAPLSDSLTIDDGYPLGRFRTFGAVGFALAALGAAWTADRLGISVIFPIYTACLLIAALSLAACGGRDKGNPAGDERNRSAGEAPAGDWGLLLRNRPYVLLVICAFFINGTDMANNTYFGFLYLEGGGTLAGVGVAFFLMAGSEAPFMAASDRMARRLGQGRLLLITMVFSILRFGIFAMGPSSGVLLLLFPLQGLVNGITLVEFVRFAADTVPARLHGMAIAVYYALGSSFSTIVCQLIGGRLLDHGLLSLTGVQSVYLFFAIFNVIGVLIFWASGLHRRC
ncbi:MAG: MFS transporter [Firmicutes bacterium]|nr:MFS transporter [Bacillota bacterium]